VKKVFVILVLGVVAAFVWKTWPNLRTAGSSASAPFGAEKGVAKSDALPPSAALKIDPKAASVAPAGAVRVQRGVLPSQVTPLMEAYLSKKDWPGLMAKIVASPESGEGAYLRANLLEICATKTDDPSNAKPRKSRDERRAAFLSSLPTNHPENDLRINAWDTANPLDNCKTLHEIKTTRKEIAELYSRAKELNDPVALARELNCEIFATDDPIKNSGLRGHEINDSRDARIRASIASRNPDAVRAGVGMLANTYRNGAFRFANDGSNVNQAVMHHAANLLACQYGADCAGLVQAACYQEGKCNANSYEDYLAFYALSPNDAQTVEAYRQRLTQMIDANDFSGLRLIKGEQPTDSVRGGSYFICN
jgi:hypothetical protein